MDALDYRILTLLSDNARRPFAELARELGVSQPTVAEQVRRMEERGVILGSSLRLDYGKLGFPITALVRIVLNTGISIASRTSPAASHRWWRCIGSPVRTA